MARKSSFVGSQLVSSFIEMNLALSQEEESQCTVHRGNTRQRSSPACQRGIRAGVPVLLARAVRRAGASRSALAGGLQQNLDGIRREESRSSLTNDQVCRADSVVRTVCWDCSD